MKSSVLLAIVLLIIPVLTACAGADEALEDTDWVLEYYGEEDNLAPALQGSEPSARFNSDDGQVSGSAGCNHYFAVYELDGENLTIRDMGSTEMWCEGKMDQEREFMDILNMAESYQVTDDELRITGGGAILIFSKKQ